MTDGQLSAAAHDVVTGALADIDAEIVEISMQGSGQGRTLRVTLDPDPAQDLEAGALGAIEKATKAISWALDEADPIDGAYTLEVTTPGADRPLTTSRDFARNVGRDVALTLADETELTGKVTETADDAVTLTAGSDTHTIPLADIRHAAVVLPW